MAAMMMVMVVRLIGGDAGENRRFAVGSPRTKRQIFSKPLTLSIDVPYYTYKQP